MPVNPSGFNADWDPGLGFGIGIGHPIDRRFALVGHFNYNKFRYRREVSRYENGDLTLFSFSACLKTRFGEDRKFYAASGIGYFDLSTDRGLDSNPWQPENLSGVSQSDFALFLGPGIDIELSKVISAFFEIQYIICLTGSVSTHYVPIKLGISIDLPGKNMNRVK